MFADSNEALLAYTGGYIDLHTQIIVRIGDIAVYQSPPPMQPNHPLRGRIETTIGRLIFNDILPASLGYRNYSLKKDALKALVAECLSLCGEETTIHLLDDIKRIGYQYATKSGISFAISDITTPPERERLIASGKKQAEEIDILYRRGEMTYDEWYRQVVAMWTHITEEISSTLEDVLDPFGSIMTIVKSGATKAKFQQIRQLSGIRGLMANPSGKILPTPIPNSSRVINLHPNAGRTMLPMMCGTLYNEVPSCHRISLSSLLSAKPDTVEDGQRIINTSEYNGVRGETKEKGREREQEEDGKAGRGKRPASFPPTEVETDSSRKQRKNGERRHLSFVCHCLPLLRTDEISCCSLPRYDTLPQKDRNNLVTTASPCARAKNKHLLGHTDGKSQSSVGEKEKNHGHKRKRPLTSQAKTASQNIWPLSSRIYHQRTGAIP